LDTGRMLVCVGAGNCANHDSIITKTAASL
jgi:hypothetical protein